MKTINELMINFKDQLAQGRIQKAYRYIFEIVTDVGRALKARTDKSISTNALYHGYLDMTYLPVTTGILKSNGLKIAVVFNYSTFQFEIWLSAVNRKKREEFINLLSVSNWNTYKPVENDQNLDAIIEWKIEGVNEFDKKGAIVSLIVKETMSFITHVEKFINNNMSE